MVSYTAQPGESLEAFLKRAGYTHTDRINKQTKPTLIANCLSLKKETPAPDDIPEEFKADKKKEGHQVLDVTALVRMFKAQSAENKRRRAEETKEHAHGLDVKGGRVSKR